MIDFELEDFARTQVQAVLGSESSVTRVERLQSARNSQCFD
jgi:hypothetical protein